MPKTRQTQVPSADSPVLEAWELASQMESQGVDVWTELNKATGTAPVQHIDPTAPVSEAGLPLIQRQWITGLASEKVGSLFYDWVLSAAGRDDAEWDLTTQRLHAMPQPWRLIYTMGSLQAAVDNGGHEQFFSNSRGEWEDETEADLSFIRADPFLNLFREARRCFSSAPADHTERIPEIEPLDDAFYSQKESLFALLGEYILTHLEDYCVD